MSFTLYWSLPSSEVILSAVLEFDEGFFVFAFALTFRLIP
jgi:hypothetical protein